MKKFSTLLFIVLLFAQCAPKVSVKETKALNFEIFQENLVQLYERISGQGLKGKFIYQSQNLNFQGDFLLRKEGQTWILVLQNPLLPYVIKISEDTLHLVSAIKNRELNKICRTAIDGNIIYLNCDSEPVRIETHNYLPVRITDENADIAIHYKGSNLTSAVIQSKEFTIQLKVY